MMDVMIPVMNCTAWSSWSSLLVVSIFMYSAEHVRVICCPVIANINEDL